MFLGCIKSERQDLEAVKEAHAELQREHAELSLQAKVQAQHIYELEVVRHTHTHTYSGLSVPKTHIFQTFLFLAETNWSWCLNCDLLNLNFCIYIKKNVNI